MRIRWPFTIIWTALCALAIWTLIEGASAPVDPRCFEYCDLGWTVARTFIPLIVVVWLTVTVVANWLWTWATRIRCPRCRQIVEPTSASCPNCGYDLVQDRDPTPEPDDRSATSGPTRSSDQVDGD
jgi:hypothetical protein